VESVYIDVPTTPSVPYTYANEEMNSITLLHPHHSGKHPEHVPLDTLPLVGSIAGFMDILRVYTTSDNRPQVTRAVESLFRNNGPLSGI